MSNPNKPRWWRKALGSGIGNVVGFTVSAFAHTIIGPVGVGLDLLIGGSGAFAGGIVGSIAGQWLDEVLPFPDSRAQTVKSAILFTTVVCGAFSALLLALIVRRIGADNPAAVTRAFFAVGALSGFLASMSLSLVDDLRAATVPR